MRSSPEPEIIGVLDTKPECMLLDEAIARTLSGLKMADLSTVFSLGERFETEALKKGSPVITYTDGTIIPYKGVKKDPQFSVREEDVSYVAAVARKKLEEPKLSSWAIIKQIRMRRAARNIIAFLDEE